MARLREGSTLVLWERCATALSWDRGAVVLEPGDCGLLAAVAAGEQNLDDHPELRRALQDHVVEGEPTAEDPTTAERLLDIDRSFTAWIPGFWGPRASRLGAIAAMQARRRLKAPPRLARATLPSSTLRRVEAIEAQNPGRVFLDDDPDGLAILLAASTEVFLFEPPGPHRDWLSREAMRAGVEDRLTITQTAPPSASCDAALITMGPPRASYLAVARAREALGPNGLIYATLRAPWDHGLLGAIGEAGFEIQDHLREIDHPILPTGNVIDGGGDLVVLAGAADATLPEPPEDIVDAIRAQPYFWLDFDSLVPERTRDPAIEAFVDAVACQSLRPEAMRSILRDEKREVACWYDQAGMGFTAEMTRQEGHLLVSLMPYDLDLEYAVECAAFSALGDPYTRMRPHRTGQWRKEEIVG